MKHTISILFLVTLLLSCNSRKSAEIETNDDLVELVSTIEFSVKAPNDTINEDGNGIIPLISMESPENYLTNLIDADQIVIIDKSITLIIDYPLDNPATFDLTSENGFSKKLLIQKISEKYHEIYIKEEYSASIKTTPMGERKGLINRNKTNGEYGIWGHDLSDLYLTYIEVYKNQKGKIHIILGIES